MNFRSAISPFVIVFTFLFAANSNAQTCNNWLRLPSYRSYVEVGDLDVPGDKITVEAMFMRTTPYANGPVWAGDLVSKHNNPPDANYLLRPNNAEITTSNGYFITPNICEIQLNKIYHAAMVYDGATLKFYRNGFLMSSVACTGNMFQNDFETRIGLYDALVHNTNLIGYINEVRIWNVARSQAQIRSTMSTSLSNPATQPGLLAYYTFDNLLNKQGNANWNGATGGSAVINSTIPNCTFVADSCGLFPQQDSVIVNDYTPVLSFDPCKNFINVENATAFKAGDTVLMIQMKGAVIDSSNTAAFGNITNYRNAGNYEFNYVKSKNGNQIELLNVINRQYDIPDGKVQLIRVPYYQNLVTSSVLTCLPWDGSKGGVLVFNVANTLQLNQNIDVSARGFKGGAAVTNPDYTCGITNYFFRATDGKDAARKGEGIFNSNTLFSGRGKSANGGGGGNSTNAGGGGGGNAGMGGAGGRQYAGCSNVINGGVGGLNLPYSNGANKVFLGAGGGAGHMNDIPALAPGGNGGGLIIISCNTLNTNGFTINSRGGTPDHIIGTNDDGKSGGGAGGTILLSYTNAGNIVGSVKGGDGDFCASSPATGGVRHGPGGGGGGGLFWINKPALAPGMLLDMSGGLNGTNINFSNDAWTATAGTSGFALTNLQLPFTTVPFKANIDSVRIRKNQTSCKRFDFEGLAYVNTSPASSWEWHFGDGATAATQNANHTYATTGNYTVKLIVTDINGCKDSTITQVQPTAIEADFTFERDACNILFVSYVTTASGYDNISWNFGDGNTVDNVAAPTNVYPALGTYEVTMILQYAHCVDSIKKLIILDLITDPLLVLTNDTTICVGATKQLLTAPALSFCWTPTTYLNNPASANPVTSTPADITYYFTAQVTGANLIQNGSFTQGNTGFNSQYTFTGTNTTEGQYNIGTNAQSWNGALVNCPDHTSGTGNVMMVNGAPATDVNVWAQTVTVLPNTNYAFSTWIQSLGGVNPAQLQFAINGRNIGALIRASANPCDWIQFYTTWNSGANTTAVISIVNRNTIREGNDFALDDISFAPVFMKRDSVKISIEKPLVQTNADTTVCLRAPVQLSATGAQTYSWSPATDLSNSAIANPVATAGVSTEFIVTGTSSNGCIAKDTVNVNIFDKPAISITDDVQVCKNTPVQLSVSGGISYTWFPGATLSNTAIADPVANPAGDTKYYVSITDANTCHHLDSVMVTLRPDPVFAITGPDKLCLKDSVQLLASGGNSYVWQTAPGISNTGIANPMVSPAVTTDYTVTITETTCNQSATLSTRINVLPLPNVVATRSNDLDCSNDRSQLNAGGAVQYAWTPALTLNNAGIANPVASPVASTSYIVAGTDAEGCTSYDTVMVKVDGVNKGGYLMPNAFSPNNDGLNDCYGIRYWGVVQKVEFSIYNRWGERIFFTRDPNQCWDGTYKGKKQDAGVFVYMIKANTFCENDVFRKGTFVLVK